MSRPSVAACTCWTGIAGDAPSARLVASFPRKTGTYCAIPVIAGSYYLVTVPAWNAVVSLDISNPASPREVGRVTLGHGRRPALDRDLAGPAPRGDHRVRELQHRVMIARFDPATGQLALDERFREDGAAEPGFRMDNKTWPHGGNAKGIPHGAVFSRP